MSTLAEQRLAEKERIQAIRDYYEQECLKALEGGPPIPLTPDFWDKVRENVRQRRQAKQAEKTA